MPLHPTGGTAAAPVVALAVPPAGERSVMALEEIKCLKNGFT